MILPPEPNQVIWLDGEFISWNNAALAITAHHYAIGVFEGVRSYQTGQGTAIFRLTDHTDRLFRSAHILNIPISYTKEQLNKAQQEILRQNKLQSAYLRPFVFYDGITGLSLHTHLLETHTMIVALGWQEKTGAYWQNKSTTTGIKVLISSLTRHHPNSVFSKAKANGNYMNSILALQEARARGADDAILLDPQGFVAEGSGANIFIVRNQVLYTPAAASILEGITRETVFKLAADLDISVREKSITRDEIYIADEAFFTGTAVGITPIIEVDGRKIGTGQRGVITGKLQDLYDQITSSQQTKYNDWLTHVNFDTKEFEHA